MARSARPIRCSAAHATWPSSCGAVVSLLSAGSGASTAARGSLVRVQREPGARHQAAVGRPSGRPTGDAWHRRAVHDHADGHADLRADPRPYRSSCCRSTASSCRRFEPEQRRRMLPLTLAIPFLFVAGVMFGYFVVLPAALHFFQNFNSGEFNVLVQASQYYKFAATTLLAMGLLFQVPVGDHRRHPGRAGDPEQLRHNRRYAVAGLWPGRRGAPGRRHHDAARDGAAVPAVRVQRAAREHLRTARRGTDGAISVRQRSVERGPFA